MQNQIEDQLQRITVRFFGLSESPGKIPAIESDAALHEIRELYDMYKKWLNYSLDQIEIPVVSQTTPEATSPVDAPETLQEELANIRQVELQKMEVNVTAPVQTEERPYAVLPGLFSDEEIAEPEIEALPILNETLASVVQKDSLSQKLKMQPISNLNSAIGVNERFIFVSELFNGNAEEFSTTIDHICTLSSFNEAEEYIRTGCSSRYNWNLKNKYVRGDFYELMQRKFM